MLTMQDDGVETSATASSPGKARSDTIDLADQSLIVDISDALCERNRVKFTVHTKTTLPNFAKPEFSVIREHEEFIWLHDAFVDNEDYAGFIIPPAPPQPNFEASREKLQKLGECEGTKTKEEFNKMKQELEVEYLATFKKTVAQHEMFLQRLTQHPIFRDDSNLKVFLEYEKDLNVRGKNKKEKIAGIFSYLGKSADELILSQTQKDSVNTFEQERAFLTEYHTLIKDATAKADRMTRMHKNVADSYARVATGLTDLATIECPEMEKFLPKVADTFEKCRKHEGRVATDEDLKLSDLLRYYTRETEAAKDLLFRRLRCLANYELANRQLDKARNRNKDVKQAEDIQREACERFESISKQAEQELGDFKKRRVANFKKSLVELAELEIKHAKNQAQLLRNTVASLKKELVTEA